MEVYNMTYRNIGHRYFEDYLRYVILMIIILSKKKLSVLMI